MSRPNKASTKPYAIRVYITDPKQVKPTLALLRKAAKQKLQSVSSFVLGAAIEAANQIVGGR